MNYKSNMGRRFTATKPQRLPPPENFFKTFSDIKNKTLGPQPRPPPSNYFKTFSSKKNMDRSQNSLLPYSNYFKTFSVKKSKNLGPQPLPPPSNYFKTFSAKKSVKKPTSIAKRLFSLLPQRLPPPLNVKKNRKKPELLVNVANKNSFQQFLEKNKKCPPGSRKNRKTKICEPLAVIQAQVKRKYTKGTLQRCKKGTYRNKINNNCEPKLLWTADQV